MRDFTDERITAAIEQVVAQAGEDYVYPPAMEGADCMYEDQYGGCIVGRTMRLLDPGINFSEGDFAGAQPWSEDLSEAAMSALSDAQSAQDSGNPWYTALARFRDTMRRMKELSS